MSGLVQMRLTECPQKEYQNFPR